MFNSFKKILKHPKAFNDLLSACFVSHTNGDGMLKETPCSFWCSYENEAFILKAISLLQNVYCVVGFGELHLCRFLLLRFLLSCPDSLFNISNTPRLHLLFQTHLSQPLSPLPSLTTSSTSRCQTPLSLPFVQLITVTKLNSKQLSPAYTWLKLAPVSQLKTDFCTYKPVWFFSKMCAGLIKDKFKKKVSPQFFLHLITKSNHWNLRAIGKHSLLRSASLEDWSLIFLVIQSKLMKIAEVYRVPLSCPFHTHRSL